MLILIPLLIGILVPAFCLSLHFRLFLLTFQVCLPIIRKLCIVCVKLMLLFCNFPLLCGASSTITPVSFLPLCKILLFCLEQLNLAL